MASGNNIREITFLTSAARTSSRTSVSDGAVDNFDEILLVLDVTAASGTSPTLDVDYQISTDGGTRW